MSRAFQETLCPDRRLLLIQYDLLYLMDGTLNPCITQTLGTFDRDNVVIGVFAYRDGVQTPIMKRDDTVEDYIFQLSSEHPLKLFTIHIVKDLKPYAKRVCTEAFSGDAESVRYWRDSFNLAGASQIMVWTLRQSVYQRSKANGCYAICLPTQGQLDTANCEAANKKIALLPDGEKCKLILDIDETFVFWKQSFALKKIVYNNHLMAYLFDLFKQFGVGRFEVYFLSTRKLSAQNEGDFLNAFQLRTAFLKLLKEGLLQHGICDSIDQAEQLAGALLKEVLCIGDNHCEEQTLPHKYKYLPDLLGHGLGVHIDDNVNELEAAGSELSNGYCPVRVYYGGEILRTENASSVSNWVLLPGEPTAYSSQRFSKLVRLQSQSQPQLKKQAEPPPVAEVDDGFVVVNYTNSRR